MPNPKGPPSSLVQLRAADNSCGARDTRPIPDIDGRRQLISSSLQSRLVHTKEMLAATVAVTSAEFNPESRLSRITGLDCRAPSRLALCVADSSPRKFQRKAGSNIAPLLQPQPKSSTEQRGRGTRNPLGGAAGLPDRPELREGAGEFPSIFERPCRDARRVPRGCPS